MKIRKKQEGELNTYEASLERMRYLFDVFDNVVVSFSAGKDSTAVLNLALTVAEERGKLPLKVVFFDEEAIHPPTIEYARRVYNDPRVDMDWFCLQVKHRNACSDSEPFWYCWDDQCKEKWVRDMPEEGIVDHPKFSKGMSFQEFAPMLYAKTNSVFCTGMRSQESLRRYRIIAMKKNDSYIGKTDGCNMAHPVYDWTSEDVWRGVAQFGWDYNTTYDIFNKTDMYGDLLRQRVCPPYGEEPLRGLWIYSECFPEMWHKMLYRVAGVATAYRYANTELYSNTGKPEGLTWRQYTDIKLDNYDRQHANIIKKNINGLMKEHRRKTNDPIADDTPHPLSGASWKFFAKIAIKGDFKGRQSQNMLQEGANARDKQGISMKEAEDLYGKV